MLANSLLIVLVFYGILFGSVTCENGLKPANFLKIKQGMRVNEGFVHSGLEKLSLIACSHLCSNNVDCDGFQFIRSSKTSRWKGNCELLSFAGVVDVLESSAIPDSSCTIYQNVDKTITLTSVVSTATTITSPSTTVTSPSTTLTSLSTTVTSPSTIITSSSTTLTSPSTSKTTTAPTTTETPICAYAGNPVQYSCTCSTPIICNGIYTCNATYSDKKVSYYIDHKQNIRVYDNSIKYCNQMKMKLLMIKTMEEQATVCNILLSISGIGVKEEFWMGLNKRQAGSTPYKYIDNTRLGTYSAWVDDQRPPFGCVFLADAEDGFKWRVGYNGNCEQPHREEYKATTMCSKEITLN